MIMLGKMNYPAGWLACAVAVLALLVSCGKDNPAETPEGPKTDPEPIEESVVVNGTVIKPKNTLYGLITNAKTGEGIPDVPVTDGYTFTTTDANGVYQFIGNTQCRIVYYSLPAGYKVTLDKTTKLPLFYSTSKIVMKGLTQNRNDFKLEPLGKVETNFTYVAVGDPQCKYDSDVSRFKNETIPDMKSYLSTSQNQGKYPNIYIMSMGDIIFDWTSQWEPMRDVMANFALNDGTYVPFFNMVGNHDHDASTSTQYASVQNYINLFGPTDYSFDRGNVHFVVMDNTQVTTSNGTTWKYEGGFTDEQLTWLKGDLALVKDKESKMIFFCTHIPFRGGGSSGASVSKTRHYAEVLSLLTDFHEAHIMVGHTHYPQNWIHNDYVTKGGTPVYEHVHGAACGAWWCCNMNVNGQPNGYSIYEVTGNTVKNWVAKGTGLDDSYQMRVYDGNQTYGGKKGTPTGTYTYTWYSGGTGSTKNITAKGDNNLKGAFVAAIWNDDEENWKVELYQNGSKVGDFQRVPSRIPDICVVSYYFNKKGKNTTTWTTTTAQHWWYCPAPTGYPAKETNWEVRATQTIPSSGVVNTYTCSTLQTDYTGF